MKFAWQTFASPRLFTSLVYVSTYCVPIALLGQNKPFPILYLGHAQIISSSSHGFWSKNRKIWRERVDEIFRISGVWQVVCALRSLSIIGGIQNLISWVKMVWSEHLDCGVNIRQLRCRCIRFYFESLLEAREKKSLSNSQGETVSFRW